MTAPAPLDWLALHSEPTPPLSPRAVATITRRTFAAAPQLQPTWDAVLSSLPEAVRMAILRIVGSRTAAAAGNDAAPPIDPAVWIALAHDWAAALQQFPAQLAQCDGSTALALKYCDADARARSGSGVEWSMAATIAARYDADYRVIAIPTRKRKRCDYAVLQTLADGTLGDCIDLYEIKAFVSPLPELVARNGLIVKRMLRSGAEQLLVTRADAALAQAVPPVPYLVVVFAESDRAVVERIAPHLTDPAATAQHAAEQLIARVLVEQQQRLRDMDPAAALILATYNSSCTTQLFGEGAE